ncbi:MgtC/SapB family protein [Candidatus Woesearchaeota archaeon]|nr:MgtC/SapB family protein [Candidatus Woesearchaeota archaeon]
MELQIIFLRIFLTFILSLVYGLQRQKAHKPIGFGTFTFVSVGACALGITAIIFNPENPLPLMGSIVTGVGFLGAGALIRNSEKVFGFTSAASIWLFSIIGVLIGVGDYLLGVTIYALIWVVIYVDSKLKFRGIGSYQKKIIITANKNVKDKELTEVLGTDKYTISSLDVNRKDSKIVITLQFEGNIEEVNRIPHNLFKEEWVDSFKIE